MSNIVPMRQFNADGIKAAAKILENMRCQKTLLRDDVAKFVADLQYLEDEPLAVQIDLDRKFASKQEFIDYFNETVPSGFIDEHRKDSGLWTWLAFAYAPQLATSSRNIVRIATNICWIFDPEEYRFSRRHFLAGPVLVSETLKDCGPEIRDILFSAPLNEYGRFFDAITYKMEGVRTPALLQVAAWLYYKPTASQRVKTGAMSQTRPGALRELIRVVAQLNMTRDFYDVKDAHELWSVLPDQFDQFKEGADH